MRRGFDRGTRDLYHCGFIRIIRSLRGKNMKQALWGGAAVAVLALAGCATNYGYVASVAPYQTVKSAKHYTDLASCAAQQLDEAHWDGALKRVNTMHKLSDEAEIVQTLGNTDNVIAVVSIHPYGISGGSEAAVRLTPNLYGSDRLLQGDRFVAAIKRCG
jgi:hypothetical protein